MNTDIQNSSDILTIVIMGILNVIQAIGNVLKIAKSKKQLKQTQNENEVYNGDYRFISA